MTYNITLNKKNKSIKVVNRNKRIRLTHTGRPGPEGPAGQPGENGTIVAVQNTPPANPNIGDLWVDTSL